MTNSTIIPPEPKEHTQAMALDHSASQNTLRNIGLICGREYKNQVTRRSFMITTIIYLLVITIGSFVPTIIQYIGAHSNSQTIIVVINNAGNVAGISNATLIHAMEMSLNGSESSHFTVQAETVTDLDNLKKLVKDGKFDILLTIDRTADQDVNFTYYTNSGSPTDSDSTQVRNIAGQLSIQDRAERQHLSPAQVNTLLAQPQFSFINLQQGQDNRSLADKVTGFILAYVGAILMFIAIMMYGIGVAQGVAEEKSSRVMEILINAATPFQLMVGKILGIGAAGLTQMGMIVLVGISMLAIQVPIQAALLGKTSGLTISTTSTSISMLLLLLLYFILGFALYSSLYAAAGALSNGQEDARNAGTPINMIYMIGYIVSVSIASIPGIPDMLWVKVMSYVPFWSPTMMLMRIEVSTVAWWEILLTVGLMIAAFPICAWISARIYRFGILMYGQRFSLSQITKLVRSR